MDILFDIKLVAKLNSVKRFCLIFIAFLALKICTHPDDTIVHTMYISVAFFRRLHANIDRVQSTLAESHISHKGPLLAMKWATRALRCKAGLLHLESNPSFKFKVLHVCFS